MSLPHHFDDPEEYFEECLQFFREYQYLYDFPNTNVLIHNIFDKITIQDEEIDVYDDSLDLSDVDDEFLCSFFKKLKRLQVVYEDFQEDPLENNVVVPLSPKKKHEIIYLAGEIKAMCKHVDCEVVVDFGSGLGYLDQLLFETANLKVLGLECNENYYVSAKKRQRKYHENSTCNVKFKKHTVSADSHANILEYLRDKFENHREFCITGLHACADLTIGAMNLFLKMPDAKAIVIMPCCYHKMSGNEGVFKNFPLSHSFKNLFGKFKGEQFMRVPFLRLAAQPPSVSNKLEDLVFNLLSRAVLQLIAFKYNCKLKRNKRKAVKTKSMDNNFETYLQDAIANGFTFIKNESSDNSNNVDISELNLEELMSFWRQISQVTFKKAGVFILLQNYLQPVIENLVLYDRLNYLKENGVKHCEIKKIFNEKLSPRCLALLAYK